MPDSNKPARTHTHASNRSKKGETSERKVVFKSALGNPYQIQWPSVPVNVQNSFLTCAISILDGLSVYFDSRERQNRQRKRARKSDTNVGTLRKRRKVNKDSENEYDGKNPVAGPSSSIDLENVGDKDSENLVTDTGNVDKSHDPERTLCEPPTVLQHLTMGINEVTKRLEHQIRNSRRVVTVSGNGVIAPNESQPPLKLVFVCRDDVDPPLLIAHLPYLVATYNSSLLSSTPSQMQDCIKLVPLPKGAEQSIAEVIGLRRLAVMAIDCNAPELSTFSSFLDSVPTLSAAWLIPPVTQDRPRSKLIPTHIKQIRTSAPKDMKAVKAHRTEGRNTAKRKKKSEKALEKGRTTNPD